MDALLKSPLAIGCLLALFGCGGRGGEMASHPPRLSFHVEAIDAADNRKVELYASPSSARPARTAVGTAPANVTSLSLFDTGSPGIEIPVVAGGSAVSISAADGQRIVTWVKAGSLGASGTLTDTGGQVYSFPSQSPASSTTVGYLESVDPVTGAVQDTVDISISIEQRVFNALIAFNGDFSDVVGGSALFLSAAGSVTTESDDCQITVSRPDTGTGQGGVPIAISSSYSGVSGGDASLCYDFAYGAHVVSTALGSITVQGPQFLIPDELLIPSDDPQFGEMAVAILPPNGGPAIELRVPYATGGSVVAVSTQCSLPPVAYKYEVTGVTCECHVVNKKGERVETDTANLPDIPALGLPLLSICLDPCNADTKLVQGLLAQSQVYFREYQTKLDNACLVLCYNTLHMESRSTDYFFDFAVRILDAMTISDLTCSPLNSVSYWPQ